MNKKMVGVSEHLFYLADISESDNVQLELIVNVILHLSKI